MQSSNSNQPSFTPKDLENQHNDISLQDNHEVEKQNQKNKKTKKNFFNFINSDNQKVYSIVALSISLILLIIGGGVWIVSLYLNINKLSSQVSSLTAERDLQKQQKDEIRNIWEDQAALNDNLTYQQNVAIGNTLTYQELLMKLITVVDREPRLNKATDLEKLKFAEDNLFKTLLDIDKLLDDNSRSKLELKSRVDTLYQQAQEDQERRANPRDGVR
jgi:hypothetical protein